MKLWRVFRMLVGFGIYLFALVFVLWPTGMWQRMMLAIWDADDGYRRRMNNAHVTRWGDRLGRIIFPLVGTKIVFHLPSQLSYRQEKRPRIYVINHRSVLDALILLMLAHRMGDDDMRWVIKLGMLNVPFLGGLMRGTGNACIMRRKDRPNLNDESRRRFNRRVMYRFMNDAQMDAVSVGIFPEGERFKGPERSGARQHVGELRGLGGFTQMCTHMTRHLVVDATIVWPPTTGGRTMFETDVFCDQTIHVYATMHPHIRPEEAEEFLECRWDEKEEMMMAT